MKSITTSLEVSKETMEDEFAKFTPEQDEILEDTTSMEEKLEECTRVIKCGKCGQMRLPEDICDCKERVEKSRLCLLCVDGGFNAGEVDCPHFDLTWQERFDKEYLSGELHLDPMRGVPFGRLKDFINSEITRAKEEERTRIEKVVEKKKVRGAMYNRNQDYYKPYNKALTDLLQAIRKETK